MTTRTTTDKIRANNNKQRWDEIYRKKVDESPDVDESIHRLVGLLQKRQAKRVLDLGCGSGRHTVFLANNSFEVYGIDISSEGLKSCRRRLAENNLHAKLAIGSIYEELPYKQSFFDAVVCIRVINHAIIENVRKAIREIERVLKPGGLVLISVRKRAANAKRHNYKIIAPRTYVPLEGDEKGIIHYSFTKGILKKEFKNFKIIDFWTDESAGYYCLLGGKSR